MGDFNFAYDSSLFTCPTCRQQISDSRIHEHIRNCELYSPRPSLDDSYSSAQASNYSNSYHYNYTSSSSSESEFKEEEEEDSAESVPPKQSTPSKTHSIAVCPVCFCNFHNTRHPPLLLPACGHTVCKPCLKDIREKSHKFCCPICRAGNKSEIKTLPLNYALLELTERKDVTKCLKHELEYVAYCLDDDSVLCGACIFDHKTHNCSLLTDDKLNSLLGLKKKTLKKDTDELISLKGSWSEALQKMEEHIHKINECVEIHKEGVTSMEKKMIRIVQEGSKMCVQELAEFATHESLRGLKSTFSHSLASLDKEITNVKEKIEKFEMLTMAEKLENTSLAVIKDTKEIPSSAPILALLDKLKVFVDYKEAIMSQKMF